MLHSKLGADHFSIGRESGGGEKKIYRGKEEKEEKNVYRQGKESRCRIVGRLCLLGWCEVRQGTVHVEESIDRHEIDFACEV